MKTNMIRAKVSVSTAAFFAAFVLITASVTAEDLNAVFKQGRAAFYRNDYATAYQLLSRVAAANPKHTETNNMLAFIRANHKIDEGTLKKQYDAVMLPKVDMQDVTLAEAIDGLRVLSKNASGGKVTPNFMIKGADLGERKLTLALNNIPLTEALTYITQLTNTKATYDKHVVIITGMADVLTSSVETDVKDSK
ncbi:MAG: hypothetical protein R3F13_01305 [Prosthecobacter sp.]